MSIFSEPTFEAQSSNDDMIQPTDMMGPDSMANQAQSGANGFAPGSPTRALLMLWFSCLVLKWMMAWFFRAGIKG